MKLGVGVPEPYIAFDGTFTSPRLDHPECVVVDADGALWCGGEMGQIYRIEDQHVEEVASTGGFTLGMALDKRGGLFVCDLTAACVWRLDIGSGGLEVFAKSVDGHELLTPNYPLVLPDGSLLVTDSGVAHVPRAGLIRFDPRGVGSVWHDQPLNFANGLALSEDNSVLFVVESWASRILAIDLDEQCLPRGPMRIHAELPGYLPDGIAVGPEDMLYVGCYEPSAILLIPKANHVELFAHDEFAHMLCHPTNLAFRGSELIASNLGRWHLTGFDLTLKNSEPGPSRRAQHDD